jgi:formate hydrogenlyase subunit 3/multisubunit Na+/H+ antiporter MnhD subunit
MLRRRLVDRARGYAQLVTIGTSILLIAIGAIMKYAVTAETDFIDLQTAGVVLMLVGILGLILSLVYTFMWSPQAQARARRRDPDPYEQPTRRY